MSGCEITMGPVPYIDVRHLWDRSRIELSDTYGTSPIHNSEISMGPVPCCVLRHLWDRSHVWFSGTYGTGPIAHMGLQNITSNNHSFRSESSNYKLGCLDKKRETHKQKRTALTNEVSHRVRYLR